MSGRPQNSSKTYFQLIQTVGSNGKYQRMLAMLFYLISYVAGGTGVIFPYLFFQDSYIYPPFSASYNHHQHICSLPASARLQYIPNPSIQSLSGRFGDYRCGSEQMEISWAVSLAYSGKLFGSIFMTLIGGLMSRKQLLVGNLILAPIGLLITMQASSLAVAVFGLFIVKFGMGNAFRCQYCFTSETMEKPLKQQCQVMIMLSFGVGVLLNVIWFLIIRNWLPILFACYFLPLIFIILFIVFFVQDTPMCLVNRYTPQQALKSFKIIQKVNRIHNPTISLDMIMESKKTYLSRCQGSSKSNSFSILDLFRYKSLRSTTILLMVLISILTFQYYAPALMLDRFNLSLFVNGLAIGVSEILSYATCFYTVPKISRRNTALWCCSITLICSIILTFLWKQDGSDGNESMLESIAILFLVFTFRFAISVYFSTFYVYYNELYPTQVRVLGTSLVSTLGSITVSLCPLFIWYCFQIKLPIMVLFTLTSILCLAITRKLPQTFGTLPKDEIEELASGEQVKNQQGDSTISSKGSCQTKSTTDKKNQ